MLVSTMIAVSMIAVGVLVWRFLQKQEKGDTTLQRRFDADDRRAKAGRDRAARGE